MSKKFQPDDGGKHKFTFVTHKWDNSNVGLVADSLTTLNCPPHQDASAALTLVYSKTGADSGLYVTLARGFFNMAPANRNLRDVVCIPAPSSDAVQTTS